MTQSELLPPVPADEASSPEDIVARARAEHPPVRRAFALFSGGGDSSVVAHRCRELYDELAFVDTGTAAPGVREHVEAFATQLGKPLRILEQPHHACGREGRDGDEYARIILGAPEWWELYDRERRADDTPDSFRRRRSEEKRKDPGAAFGMPGPAIHTISYNRLKLRRIEALVQDAKQHHRDRVLLLSGVRTAESARREETSTEEVERVKAQVWASPIVGWSDADMSAYREANGLGPSDVAALLHRSGECNCGNYSAVGEREMLAGLWPEWWSRIEQLEDEAEALGLLHCRWGGRDRAGRRPRVAPARVGRMCDGCHQLELSAAA